MKIDDDFVRDGKNIVKMTINFVRKVIYCSSVFCSIIQVVAFQDLTHITFFNAIKNIKIARVFV